jgi:hypothetical protein
MNPRELFMQATDEYNAGYIKRDVYRAIVIKLVDYKIDPVEMFTQKSTLGKKVWMKKRKIGQRDSLSFIPDVVFYEVIEYFDTVKDAIKFGSVSQKMAEILTYPLFWKRMIKRDFIIPSEGLPNDFESLKNIYANTFEALANFKKGKIMKFEYYNGIMEIYLLIKYLENVTDEEYWTMLPLVKKRMEIVRNDSIKVRIQIDEIINKYDFEDFGWKVRPKTNKYTWLEDIVTDEMKKKHYLFRRSSLVMYEEILRIFEKSSPCTFSDSEPGFRSEREMYVCEHNKMEYLVSKFPLEEDEMGWGDSGYEVLFVDETKKNEIIRILREFVINKILNGLYDKYKYYRGVSFPICHNFVRSYYVTTDKNRENFYSVVENLDEISDYLTINLKTSFTKKAAEDLFEIVYYIVVQVLYALVCSHKLYKFKHHDLKLDNIMVTPITNKQFREMNLIFSDNVVLKFDDPPKFIVKIIDFDRSEINVPFDEAQIRVKRFLKHTIFSEMMYEDYENMEMFSTSIENFLYDEIYGQKVYSGFFKDLRQQLRQQYDMSPIYLSNSQILKQARFLINPTSKNLVKKIDSVKTHELPKSVIDELSNGILKDFAQLDIENDDEIQQFLYRYYIGNMKKIEKRSDFIDTVDCNYTYRFCYPENEIKIDESIIMNSDLSFLN